MATNGFNDDPQSELRRLHKIISNSDELAEFRKKMGFERHEVLFQLRPKGVITVFDKSAKGDQLKIRILAKSLDEFDKCIQKEVIEKYDLKLSIDDVRRAVFRNNDLLKGYSVSAAPNTQNEKYVISITFDYLPTSEDKKTLFNELNAHMDTMEKIVREKTILPLATQPKKYRQFRSIPFFDERLRIYNLYTNAMKKYGQKKIPEAVWSTLLKHFKLLFYKMNPSFKSNEKHNDKVFSKSDLRTSVHEFRRLYYNMK